MAYKGYNEIVKKATLKYRKDKQHPISLSYRQDEYDNYIAPAIKRSGKKTATFIKEAIQEKITREHLADNISCIKKPGTVGYAISRYMDDSKKTVLYITLGDVMYTYVKADKAGNTWERAIEEYGNMECDIVSDEGYVVEIRCKTWEN